MRNKELGRFAAAFAAVSALFVLAGFALRPLAGGLVLAACAALGALCFFFTRARYAAIARLSEEIDAVLHHADRLLVAGGEEGELSILRSEIAKMTLRIREQNEALRREKRLLADSLADIAHQLRTPLTGLALTLPLLREEQDPAKRRAMLRDMQALLDRTDWLLTALLRLSQLDAGIVPLRREPTPVAALVESAARPFAVAMDLHDVALHADIPPDARLCCDPAWMGEALGNLIKNAIDSAGDHGSLHVACADTPLYTEITLRDSGPGFAREDLPRLFDRFYRGKGASSPGFGIGLALCRAVIVRQGGTIAAANHPQGGAMFTLRFPK